ncbi:MAG: NFACT family protein [Anaerolineae bacterium]|nr:NFACT family protein [Anaerolineae bacterium]
MYFDALTAAAVACELRARILGGRVQGVVQVDDLTLGLEIYAQHARLYVIASAETRHARVHLTEVKFRRGVDVPTPLLLLLRKYVRGARIAAIDQPPFERIVRLACSGPEGDVTLVVEAMGRHSNIVLVAADGQVMDSIKRVTARLSRVRPMLPGTHYAPPPPQDKLDPADLTERYLSQVIETERTAQPAWRVLVNEVRGISPLLAREIVFRATGAVDLACGQVRSVAQILDAYHELLQHAWDDSWAPSVGLGEEGRVVAYAPYLLTHAGDWAETDTIGAAIERYEGAVSSADGYGPAKARVSESLDEARARVGGRLEALQRQLIPQDELDRLRLSGEMVLAYAHAIQRGQTSLEAVIDVEGTTITIALNPDLSAVRNAQAYFERYEKAKAATAEIPALVRRARLELDYLDQLATDLDLARNWPEIDEVRSALIDAGYAPRRQRVKMQLGQPLRALSPDGLQILVGRSARQNHQVTFRHAAPDDLWLHAMDVPGAHVIVRAGGQPVPEATLVRAAELAAHYSAARGEGTVLVAYTQRRYVRPVRGAGPGMVTYRNEQTIAVSPREA